MSKKKSLGSSPIGHTGSAAETFDFIPSIPDAEKSDSGDERYEMDEPENNTVSKPPSYLGPKAVDSDSSMKNESHPRKKKPFARKWREGTAYYKNSISDMPEELRSENDAEEEEKKSPNKKIASYSLEEDLIERVKVLAKEREVYYSTVVSRAINHWLELNGH